MHQPPRPVASDIVLTGGRAYHLRIAPHEVASRIFLVGDPARAFRVAARFDAVEHDIRHREFVTLTGRLDDLPMTVIGTGIGTDNVEIALLEAWAVRGFDLDTRQRLPDAKPLTVIRVGTSGGVQRDITAGTLCISTRALGLDGTGPFFDVAPPDRASRRWERAAKRAIDAATPAGRRFRGRLRPYATAANSQVIAALRDHAARSPRPFVLGVTVSVSAFYGAGRAIDGLVSTVPAFKDCFVDLEVDGERVLNFEMESSLLFLLAQALGWRAGTICPVIGAPGRQGEVIDYEAAVEDAIDIAVAAMVDLAPR